MSVRKSGSRAVSLKSSARRKRSDRPMLELGLRVRTRSGRLKAAPAADDFGWKSGWIRGPFVRAGYARREKPSAFLLGPSGAGLHHALDRTANRPGSQRLRGKKAPEAHTQAHSDPLRTGTVRGPEHPTSNIQHPTSNGESGGKATKAPSHIKAISSHILGIY